jgi:hypothetical protein
MPITCPECGGLGELPDPKVGSAVVRPRGFLERGWRKRWLMGRLVRSEGSHAALAAALGVVPSAVTAFSTRHAAEIEAERDKLAEKLEGLWIGDKLNRLAEMQTDVEDINEVVARKIEAATPAPYNPLDPEDAGTARETAIDDVPVWLRVKTAILRAAAEELGQIPHRVQMQVGGSVVTYKIEGVDLDRV